MHQLGLTTADVAQFLHQESQVLPERLASLEAANRAAGDPQPRETAVIQYLQGFAAALLENNNHRIAADLVRLGVLPGTLVKDGEASF